MTIMPIQPDGPLSAFDTSAREPGASSFGNLVLHALGAVSASLEGADAAERSFVRGRGGLQEMMVERVQADIALSIATTTASRAAQAVSTILGMQV